MSQFSKAVCIAASWLVLFLGATASARAQDAAAQLKQACEEGVRMHETILRELRSIRDADSAKSAFSNMQNFESRGRQAQQNMLSAGARLSTSEANRIAKPYALEMANIMRQEKQEIQRIRGLNISGLSGPLSQMETAIDTGLAKMPGGGIGSISVPTGALAILFPALLFIIFLFCVAFSYREGMWGNAITLVNVILAALLAVNFFEPIARLLEGMLPSWTFLWDFISLWLPFSLFLLIFRTATRSASKFQVRFKQVHDQIGSVVFAVLLGWVMVCFTTMTLHAAPLGRNFLFGGFQPEKRMFLGLAPDRQFLGLVKLTSKGSFKRWTTREFDPQNAFIQNYADRRQMLEDSAVENQGFTVEGNKVGSTIPKR